MTCTWHCPDLKQLVLEAVKRAVRKHPAYKMMCSESDQSKHLNCFLWGQETGLFTFWSLLFESVWVESTLFRQMAQAAESWFSCGHVVRLHANNLSANSLS